MRVRTSKHQLRAGRVLFKKRQNGVENTDSTVNSQDATDSTTATDDEGGGFTLTGPITLTITRSIDPSSPTHLSTLLNLPTISVADTTSASMQTGSSSATSSSFVISQAETTPTLQMMTQSSLSAFTLTPTTTTPATKPGTQDGNSLPQDQDAQSSSKQLPAGSIVGIVVACLFVLAIILIYLFRAKIRRRRRRARSTWAGSKSFEATLPTSISSGKRNGNNGSGNGHSKASNVDMVDQNKALVVSRISLPPSSYNNNAMTAEPGFAGTSVYAMSTVSLGGPSLATVISTFQPTLPDELDIKRGQPIRVLAEYDDGWALCTNMDGSGEQGMVPLECLDRRNGKRKASTIGKEGVSLPIIEASPISPTRGNRRISSLPPRS